MQQRAQRRDEGAPECMVQGKVGMELTLSHQELGTLGSCSPQEIGSRLLEMCQLEGTEGLVPSVCRPRSFRTVGRGKVGQRPRGSLRTKWSAGMTSVDTRGSEVGFGGEEVSPYARIQQSGEVVNVARHTGRGAGVSGDPLGEGR